MAFLPFALSAGMQRFFLRLEEFPALSRWRIPSVDPISRPHTRSARCGETFPPNPKSKRRFRPFILPFPGVVCCHLTLNLIRMLQ